MPADTHCERERKKEMMQKTVIPRPKHERHKLAGEHQKLQPGRSLLPCVHILRDNGMRQQQGAAR
jgi:hypothetical protein